jgi:hypothetical protein
LCGHHDQIHAAKAARRRVGADPEASKWPTDINPKNQARAALPLYALQGGLLRPTTLDVMRHLFLSLIKSKRCVPIKYWPAPHGGFQMVRTCKSTLCAAPTFETTPLQEILRDCA